VVERSSTRRKSRDSRIIVGGNVIIWVVSTATGSHTTALNTPGHSSSSSSHPPL
jgi:hypothetical protein